MADKKYRSEMKYISPSGTLSYLENLLSAELEYDENAGADGKYEIHSLYFDDLFDTCANDNDAGASKRFKYRIRYYGSDLSTLRLERKEKCNGLCRKLMAKLTQNDYMLITENRADELFWATEDHLLRRFCSDIMERGFCPKLIVDYERTAFVEPIANVRITLDCNISVSNEVSEFLSGSGYERVPLQEKNRHVLEVKYDDILPSNLKKLVESLRLSQTAFSKYYLGRILMQNLGII